MKTLQDNFCPISCSYASLIWICYPSEIILLLLPRRQTSSTDFQSLIPSQLIPYLSSSYTFLPPLSNSHLVLCFSSPPSDRLGWCFCFILWLHKKAFLPAFLPASRPSSLPSIFFSLLLFLILSLMLSCSPTLFLFLP